MARRPGRPGHTNNDRRTRQETSGKEEEEETLLTYVDIHACMHACMHTYIHAFTFTFKGTESKSDAAYAHALIKKKLGQGLCIPLYTTRLRQRNYRLIARAYSSRSQMRRTTSKIPRSNFKRHCAATLP